METFLHEYALRSIQSFMPALDLSNFSHGYKNITTNITDNSDYNYMITDISYYDDGSNNTNQYLQSYYNDSNEIDLFDSRYFAFQAASTAAAITTAAATSTLPSTVTTTSLNESFFKFQNISCDHDPVSETNFNRATFFKVTVYLLYIPILIFALIGNGTVCYIVQSSPRMRTVTNFFIANLAVGDILMSVFCVPFSFVSIFILRYWPFGDVLCHLVNYSQAVSVLVSAYTLVAISMDRYMAIMWPLRPRITKRFAKFIIAGVWVVALVTALPIAIVSRLVPPDNWHIKCQIYICMENWSSSEQYYYYSWALFTLQFIIPLAVLIFTYTRIAIAVWGKRPPGEAENLRDQRMARSKRKMIKMMMTVVIVFTICWLPFNVLVLLLHDEEFYLWKPLPYFWFAFHWLAMSHSCYNPLIYCYMNGRFRSGFLQILYRIPGVRRWCCCGRCLRARNQSYRTTGTDDAFHLQRINTCTTYISTRRKLHAGSTQMVNA